MIDSSTSVRAIYPVIKTENNYWRNGRASTGNSAIFATFSSFMFMPILSYCVFSSVVLYSTYLGTVSLYAYFYRAACNADAV